MTGPDRKPVCSETFNLLKVSAGISRSNLVNYTIIGIAASLAFISDDA